MCFFSFCPDTGIWLSYVSACSGTEQVIPKWETYFWSVQKLKFVNLRKDLLSTIDLLYAVFLWLLKFGEGWGRKANSSTFFQWNKKIYTQNVHFVAITPSLLTLLYTRKKNPNNPKFSSFLSFISHTIYLCVFITHIHELQSLSCDNGSCN